MNHRILIAGALAAALSFASVALAQPQQGADVRAACAADLQKLCPDAKPGPGGGLRECVQAHFNDLSDPCKQAIMAMRQQMQQQQAPTNAPAATNSPAH
jgi:hypothetical protein